jgi:hypothetical protein
VRTGEKYKACFGRSVITSNTDDGSGLLTMCWYLPVGGQLFSFDHVLVYWSHTSHTQRLTVVVHFTNEIVLLLTTTPPAYVPQNQMIGNRLLGSESVYTLIAEYISCWYLGLKSMTFVFLFSGYTGSLGAFPHSLVTKNKLVQSNDSHSS